MASCEVVVMQNYKESETFVSEPEHYQGEELPVPVDQDDDSGDGIGYVVVSVDDEDVCNFDARISQLKENNRSARKNGAENEGELLKINRIFREVAQAIGAEWISLFKDLMAPSMTPEEIDSELKSLDLLRPLVRGYKALHVWRDAVGGDFSLERLEGSLVKNNHSDIATILHQDFTSDGQNDVETRKKLRNSITRRKSDVSVVNLELVDNRHLLLLSKSIGEDWTRLAHELSVDAEEVEEINSLANTTTQEKAFKMLWSWREASNKQLGKLQLNGCLGAINREELALS